MRKPASSAAAVLVLGLVAAIGGALAGPPTAAALPPGGASTAGADTTSTAKGASAATTGGSQRTSLAGMVQARLSADSTRADSAAFADSIAAAADSAKTDSAASLDRFVASNTSYATTSDVEVTLGSRMNIVSNPGGGWNLINRLGIDRKSGRTQNIETLIEDFSNTAQRIRPNVYVLNLGLGQTYNRSTTLAQGRYGLDIIYDNKNADLGFDFSKPVLGAETSRFSFLGDGRKGLNDFKYDRSLSGSASGALNYVFGNVLRLGGGLGAYQKRETSDIGARRLGPMASDADTVNALFTYGGSDTKLLDIAYQRYRGIDRRVRPPRGNSFEILNDPSKAMEEETKNTGEQMVVAAALAPFPFLSLSFNMTHNIKDQRFAIDTLQSSRVEKNLFTGGATYEYAPKGKASFTVTTRNDLSDWTFSPSASFREREHGVSMGLSQGITDSLTLTANGAGSLRQRFYLRTKFNPRDADYLYYRGDVALRAAFGKIATNVRMEGYRYETVNIARDYSIDNRVDYRYQVGPSVTFRPTGWLTIAQDYMVKIEYTDFVFTSDKNYLNRTTTLNTTASFAVFPSFAFGFRNSYIMRDTGSYLDRGAGKLYSPTGNTRENTLGLSANYQIAVDFSVRAETEFRLQTNDIYGAADGRRIVASSTLYESGGMRVGFVRSRKLGNLGNLTLDVDYLRNYGPYITPERKEYVEADAQATLNF
jgi:hypothetical protein